MSEPDSCGDLLRIAAEGTILQDEAEAVLALVSRHAHLGVVAPTGGALVNRFFRLRAQLPSHILDPRLDHIRGMLDTIFMHHAMQVTTAMEFLAVEDRSPTMHRQVSSYAGLGQPAVLLEQLYAELRNRAASERLGPDLSGGSQI